MMTEKNKWLGFAFLFLVLISGWAMRTLKEQVPVPKMVVAIQGEAQGTTYHIKYLDEEGRNFKPQIDSIFGAFELAFSNWEPLSEVNALNQQGSYTFSSPHFYPVLTKSREVYEKTGGAFDPTVAPLVKAWGFGPEGIEKVPSEHGVDSLLLLTGFERIRFDSSGIQKHHQKMQLDFNAIAPGYTVDVLAAFLKDKGLRDFFIELGGEVYACGLNEQGQPWRIGIHTPSEQAQQQMDIRLILQLQDRAVTTSGNYRRFYEQEGVKYSHTISPFTGRPVRHSLLSATVLAPDCMTADAYATAFMVLGLEQTIKIVEKQPELAVILIYSTTGGGMETYVSPELSQLLLRNDISKR